MEIHYNAFMYPLLNWAVTCAMLLRRFIALGVITCTLSYRAIHHSIFIRRNYLHHSSLMAGKKELPTDENGWRAVLNPNQFKVLREKATEPPQFSETTAGQLEYELKKSLGTKYPKEGVFNCVACDSPLYYAKTKFDSGCGWPAFYEGVPGAIKEVVDADGRRVEILCKNCGSHLGHVFKNEGFPNPTNERCVLKIMIDIN